jgi:hypothetical protein
MGFKFLGGIWKKTMQASDYPAQLEVHEGDYGLEVTHSTKLNSEMIHRLMWFSNGSPVIHCRVEERAASGLQNHLSTLAT